ncbi:fused MFS/spermidine synthase [Canibacter sp. lx-45]|uniref:spermidine synthase n=1 Tax=Canibacter zhuwentaonis TaxID=2837491 RepID=UPI001BDD3287|nr:fused MFS/spermidine synthase [Canibacter zhuwentaonis]MBT1035615.1 fused MFS/spermidine synthase [Canibacter zhuwentaonis]
MTEIGRRILASGDTAVIETDPYNPGALQLSVNGVAQSHVHPSAPHKLFFEYVQRIGNIIDAYCNPGKPFTALHLGGGALTLPRYIAATRPRSQQQVIEISADLIDFVREHIPLPKNHGIRVRIGDARAVASKLPSGLQGAVDICVADVFNGSRTPAHLTSIEFYQTLRPLLKPEGLLIINTAASNAGNFLKRELATVSALFAHVTVVGVPRVLKGKSVGNIVVVASTDNSVCELLPCSMSAGPYPAATLEKAKLTAYIAGAKPITDAAPLASPELPETLFG